MTPALEPEFLRRYVAHAKRIVPVLTAEASALLNAEYLQVRKTSYDAGGAIGANPRALEATIRFAEASARVRLSSTVEAVDAQRAVQVYEYWMARVAGEEGRFDIDIIQVGISQSQREQIVAIREVIENLAQASRDGTADANDVLLEAERRGIPRSGTARWLMRWTQEGDLYTPSAGKLKLVEHL
jgi:replicative DNA helicase Mcm